MARNTTTRNVTVRDVGWERFKAVARELDGAGVKVGIRAQDARKKSEGVAVIDYAILNELGTETIPKRPFMRHTADTSQADVAKVVTLWVGMLMAGKMGVSQLLGSLGEFYKLKTQAVIRNSKAWAVPNAPATIARKKSSTPLIDNAVLINTIDWQRDDKRKR